MASFNCQTNAGKAERLKYVFSRPSASVLLFFWAPSHRFFFFNNQSHCSHFSVEKFSFCNLLSFVGVFFFGPSNWKILNLRNHIPMMSGVPNFRLVFG